MRIQLAVCIFICAAALHPKAIAELPGARLHSLFPPGGKSGTSFEVTLSGADLDDLVSLHFSHPGITSKPQLHELTKHPLREKFLVSIDATVPPGIYEARAVGRFGVTNPRAFAVGQLDEIAENQPNESANNPMTVEQERTINGRSDANRVDFFKFPAKQGQRLLIRCAAKEIDSRMDPVLVLYDLQGRELDRNRRGGLLDFSVSADGEFLLKVHDFLFRGGNEFFYRLSITTGPHVDFVFPPAAIAGATSRHTIYGRNLGGTLSEVTIDGKRLERIETDIQTAPDSQAGELLASSLLFAPSSASLDGWEYRFTRSDTDRALSSNPVLIGFAEASVALESADNDRPDHAQKISLPTELCGQFYPAGDRDYSTFAAQKGDVYWIEVWSHRLGLPTDPFLLIQRISKSDNGQISDVQELYDLDGNIGGPDFNTATRDIVWRFEVKDTAEYRLLVRDLFNSARSDASFVYRLAVRKESPDFRLVALPQAPPPNPRDKKEALVWTPLLRRNETIPVKVLAFRRDNFAGDIELSAENLPSGVRFHPAKIEAGKNSGVLWLSADDTAKSWAGQIRILGKAKIGSDVRVRHARGGSVVWTVPDYNNEPIQSRITRDFFLAVSGSESAPIAVSAAEQKAFEAPAQAKLTIPIKIVRSGDFNEALKLKPSGLAQLDAAKEIDIDPKSTNTNVELDLGQLKLPPGTHTIFLLATTKGKYRRLAGDDLKAAEAAAKKAEETLKQTEKALAEASTAAKGAAEALANAVKQADEAQARLKSAGEKLAALTAGKTSDEISTAKATADKELAELESKAKAAADTKASAEKLASESTAKLKQAEQHKSAADELVKQTKDILKAAEPKETTVTAYSPPITITVSK